MKRFVVFREISFLVEANNKYEALEKVAGNIQKLLDDKNYCIESGCYAEEWKPLIKTKGE